jgi:hypothetical protein
MLTARELPHIGVTSGEFHAHPRTRICGLLIADLENAFDGRH